MPAVLCRAACRNRNVGGAPSVWPDFCVVAQHFRRPGFWPRYALVSSLVLRAVRHLAAAASTVAQQRANEPWIDPLWAIRALHDLDTPKARVRLQGVRPELLAAFLQRCAKKPHR